MQTAMGMDLMSMDGYSDDWERGYTVNPRQVYEDDLKESSTLAHEASDPEALEALLNFAAYNRDLDKLESLIGAFNPFKILGVQDLEIRHSNVLGWLLDPTEHHGLGDLLLRGILHDVLRDSELSEAPRISDIISASFADLNVLREWRNIDILCVSAQNHLVVVIENKIGSGESANQYN